MSASGCCEAYQNMHSSVPFRDYFSLQHVFFLRKRIGLVGFSFLILLLDQLGIVPDDLAVSFELDGGDLSFR